MQPLSESKLQERLDSGSKTRLDRYRANLRRDLTKRLFDKRAVEEAEKYSKFPKMDRKILAYLKSLKNADGDYFARSIGHYSDMEEQFINFEKPERGDFRWNSHFRTAFQRVKERYSRAHLVALEYHSNSDIYNAVTDWNTSVGWERIIHPEYHWKRDMLPNIFALYSHEESKARECGSFNKPIICGYRTQGSGAFDDNGAGTGTWKSKKRAVNIVDPYVVIAESKFGQPLNEFLKYYPYTAIGKDDAWIVKWVNDQRMKGWNYVSLDYSKYDSTIPSWLIKAAFDVIRSAFSTYDEQLLGIVEEDFIYKNVITGEGIRYFKHGNPSGSRLTAIVNGICNELMTETWLDFLGREGMYNIMGDDNLIFMTGDSSSHVVETIASYIMHNFGIKVNTDKTNFGTPSEDPEYLSRYWSQQGAWRQWQVVLSLLAYPERFRRYDGEGALDPKWLLYAYYLAYPITLAKYLNTDILLRDLKMVPVAHDNITREQSREVPYNVRLYWELHGFVQKQSYDSAVAAVSKMQ